jgi:hypothetical protein
MFLMKTTVFPLTLMSLALPGDHAFLLIGGRPGIICDPWAKLACKEVDYAMEWQKRMQRWEAKRKVVFYLNQWINPTDTEWVSSIGALKFEKILGADSERRLSI